MSEERESGIAEEFTRLRAMSLNELLYYVLFGDRAAEAEPA